MLKAFASFVVVGLASCVAQAQPASTDASIPPALRDWRPWVTKDLDYRPARSWPTARRVTG
jgi:hypothetical protein